ncbi:MAG TPA: hypothetical protein VLW45_10335, partial [Pelomicrobium sp.]|nr:hypothetical protein [Pelomicrobium sp.]
MAIRSRWPLRIALIAVLLLAAPIILPIPVPLDFARARIEAAASAALGHDVRIDAARLTTGLTPELRLRGVRVSGAPALDAKAGSVEAKILLLPLLAAELRIVEVGAEDVTADITPSAWPAAKPGAQGAGVPLRVSGPHRVTLRRAAATIHRDGEDTPLQIRIDEADAAAVAQDRSRLNARGQFRDLPASLTLDTASLDRLLRGDAQIPFDLTLELADARASATGQWRRAAGEFEATVSIDASRPKQLADLLFGVALAPDASLTLKSDVSASANRVAARDTRFVLGETVIEGSVVFDATGDRPRLTVDAHAEVLDHRTLAERTETGFELPSWLATWLALPRIGDADIKIRVDRLLTPLVEIRDGRFASSARDGVLTSHGEATIDDVPLRSETRIDATGAAPRLQVRSHASDVPIDQLAQRLGRPDLAGVAGKASFSLEAAGATADALLAGFVLKVELDGLRVAERAPPRREVARLRTLRVEAAGTGESAIRAEGTAWGERVTLDATTKELGALLGGRLSPVRFDFGIASARVSGSGELSHGADGTRGRLRVEAGARPIGPLHNLLPVNPASPLNATVAGAVEFRDARIDVDAATRRLGASAGRGRLTLPTGAAPPRIEL